MKILHYSLGLPPYRSGGLTKYSCDLMEEQANKGDSVYLLFPGQIRFINNATKIKYYKKYNKVNVYEMINPLPVPLLNGILNPKEFCKRIEKNIFIDFLNEIKVDVVHIHTFMGLYKEFLDACKLMGIKIVYTTHDYFGICTKVNFIDTRGKLCETIDIEKCMNCNKTGYSLLTIKLLQSKLYRKAKEFGITEYIKRLKSKLKRECCNNEKRVVNKIHIEKNEYQCLLNYYQNMYKLIDVFIFNSTVAKNIYNKYFEANGKIISITHKNIKDNRRKKNYDNSKLRISYLGPFKEYKGFNLLIDSIKELQYEGVRDIELNLYGDITKDNLKTDGIKFNGKYSYNDLEKIFGNTDLLIVPSICNETFGFITLEAISYGVPVLLTNKVGSKDLIRKNKMNKGIIVNPLKEEIKKKIKEINENRNLLDEMNSNIIKDKFDSLIETHYVEVNEIYK